MDWIAQESGVSYDASPAATKAHRVITDHARGMTFLAAEGITPSNEGRGYVMRRLIRRAVVQARRIGLEDVYRISRIVVEQVGPWYPEVVEHADEIERVPQAEEERFRDTLERGLREFEALAGSDGDLRRGGLHARRHVRVPARADRRARGGARPAGRRRRLPARHGRAPRDLTRGR